MKFDNNIKIGDKFVRQGTKRKDVCTVCDFMTVTNSKGEIVNQYWVAEYYFMGQRMTYEPSKTTIVRNRI
ncbi:MAG: hypothetical protein ACK5NB_08055 [Flavobacteriaceae bacterium]